MGLNTIPTRTAGIARASWFNDIRTAILGDWVPRDATGAPVDGAGSLGTTIYRWLNLFVTNLKLKSGAFTLTIKAPSSIPASYEITLPASLPVGNAPLTINSSGLGSFTAGITEDAVADGAITYAKRSALNYSVSPFISSYSNASGTPTKIEECPSFAVYGKPVLVIIIPSGTTTSKVSNTSAGTLADTVIKLMKDSGSGPVDILVNQSTQNIGTGTSTLTLPPGAYQFWDFNPGVGNFIYSLWGASGGGTLSVINCKIMAIEFG